MQKSVDEYYDMLEEIDQTAHKVTDWESNFIESILSEDKETLTPKQCNIIERMYALYIINRGINL